MQTQLADAIRDSRHGDEADAILRSCVHCGFCTATCPTYQLLGDELDGPRGRIYLIKQVLEGHAPSRKTQLHLDRCLTCRACETTCPSGVRYGRLVDIGRAAVETAVPRPLGERLSRRLLRWLVPYRRRFGLFLGVGQIVRPLLPASLRAKVPPRRAAGPWPTAKRPRTMLALAGCAQAAATPDTNAAAARVLDRFGISLVEAPRAGCCGALPHHLNAEEEAFAMMRRNIDAWWPQVEFIIAARLDQGPMEPGSRSRPPRLAPYQQLAPSQPGAPPELPRQRPAEPRRVEPPGHLPYPALAAVHRRCLVPPPAGAPQVPGQPDPSDPPARQPGMHNRREPCW